MVQGTEQQKPRDLPYELTLLERMGEVSVNGIALKNVPIFEKYSLWHRFVLFVFSSDIRRFSASRSFSEYLKGEGGQHAGVSLKGFLVGLIGVFVSLLAWLFAIIRRPQVLIFGIDRVSDNAHKADFRLHALYDFLQKNRIPYIECLHTVFNAAFLKNLFVRLRSALYLEAIDTWYAVLKRTGLAQKSKSVELSGFDAFSEEEKKFVSYAVKKYLGERGLIQFRVKALSAFLSSTRPHAVWMIDDARHYHDLALAAKLAGIPTYAFQHGHFTRYHVGWLTNGSTLHYIRPENLVVWSEYWKQELLRLGSVYPADALIVGGFPEASISLPSGVSKTLLILFVHETDSPKKEVAAYIARILEAMPEAKVVMKLRPDHPAQSQIEEYPGLAWGPRLISITNLAELKERPGIVLGVYSTFLYDMVRKGAPVSIIETSMDYGKGMVENGLADSLTLSGIPVRLRELLATDRGVLEARAKKLDSDVSLWGTLSDIAFRCGITKDNKVG